MGDNNSTDSVLRDIQYYLRDAQFPMTKQELVEWAQMGHATPQVMQAISEMSYEHFRNIDDVTNDYEND